MVRFGMAVLVSSSSGRFLFPDTGGGESDNVDGDEERAKGFVEREPYVTLTGADTVSPLPRSVVQFADGIVSQTKN
jgi:hypothetical protein